MASLSVHELEALGNPIDNVEAVAVTNDWQCDRQGDDELAIQVPGTWCEYRLWFVWRSDLKALYFSCGLDMRVRKEQHKALYPLLAMLNERLWLGHFELWSDEGWPAFRHTLLIRDEGAVNESAIEELVETAIAECERFYPAFQFVIWGGKNANDAIEAALLDTIGEA